MKVCKKHGLTEHVTETNGYSRCKKCRYESVARRRKNLKIKAVEHMGGSCSKCGYDKCVDALEFHHVDPSQKDFTISSGNILGWEKVKKELSKCILVCANCHREIHATE